VAKDVCEVLEISNVSDTVGRLDDDEKDIFKAKADLVLDVPNRGMTVVNESGLYNVIIRSDKPEAKRFRKCGA
jgi:prophage antirepressor-like protein